MKLSFSLVFLLSSALALPVAVPDGFSGRGVVSDVARLDVGQWPLSCLVSRHNPR
jgi:hypothetical protein